MIAACPTCGARYRIDTAKLRPEGARLRCSRCESVFRVRVPEPAAEKPAAPQAAPSPQPAPVPDAAPPSPVPDAAPPSPVPDAAPQSPQPSPVPDAVPPAPAAVEAPPAPPPAVQEAPPASQPTETLPAPQAASDPSWDRERLVLVAHPESEAGKLVADALGSWGLQAILVHDGVEAILNVQRALPRLVILDAALPKMFGFQVCELMKRNESLRSIHVVLVGAIHDQDRYRRPPGELYGADAYIERQELPDGLPPLLARFGLSLAGAAPEVAAPSAAPPAPQAAAVDAAEVSVSQEEVPPVVPPRLPPLAAPPPAAGPPEPPPAVQREFAPPEAQAMRRSLPPISSPESEGLVDGPPLEAPVSEPQLEFPVEAAPETELSEPEPQLEMMPPDPEPLPVTTPPPDPIAALEEVVAEPSAVAQGAAAEVVSPAAGAADPALAAEIEQADRLARIIVSDIILYNPEKFESGLRSGDVLGALSSELEEGHSLFAQRVDPRAGPPDEFLRRELVRVARSRGMK